MSKRIWGAVAVAAWALPTSAAMAGSIELTQSQIHLLLDPDDVFWGEYAEEFRTPVQETRQFGLNDGAQRVEISKDLPEEASNTRTDGLAFVDYVTATLGDAHHFAFSLGVDAVVVDGRDPVAPYDQAIAEVLLTFTTTEDLSYRFEATPSEDQPISFFDVVFDETSLRAETTFEGYSGNFPIVGIDNDDPVFGSFIEYGILAAGQHTLRIRAFGNWTEGFVSLDLSPLAIPTPAAAGMGLAMLAGVAARRRSR